MKRASFLIVFTTVFPLAACSTIEGGPAPSLSKRPYEGRFDVPPKVAPVVPPGALPADLGARLALWEAQGAEGQSGFAGERDQTARLVAAASGAAMSSEPWVLAQQAISRLIAARAPTTGALADIDRLYMDRSNAESFDGMPDIYALRERLAELVSSQDAIIESLNASLKS